MTELQTTLIPLTYKWGMWEDEDDHNFWDLILYGGGSFSSHPKGGKVSIRRTGCHIPQAEDYNINI